VVAVKFEGGFSLGRITNSRVRHTVCNSKKYLVCACQVVEGVMIYNFTSTARMFFAFPFDFSKLSSRMRFTIKRTSYGVYSIK
jgi:hypothetical protein